MLTPVPDVVSCITGLQEHLEDCDSRANADADAPSFPYVVLHYDAFKDIQKRLGTGALEGAAAVKALDDAMVQPQR